MDWLKRRRILAFILSLALLAALFLGFSSYHAALEDDFAQTACLSLRELTEQQRMQLHLRLESGLRDLANVARSLPYLSGDQKALQTLCLDYVRGSSIKQILLLDTQGNGYTQEGSPLSLGDRDYVKAALQGKTALYDPQALQKGDPLQIPLSAPIYREGVCSGVLLALYTPDSLVALLGDGLVPESRSLILDSSGNIIAQTGGSEPIHKENGFLASLQEETFTRYDDYATLRKNIQARAPGHSGVFLQGEEQLLHYTPLSINGWYLLLSTPEQLVSGRAESIAHGSNLMTLLIVLLFSVLGFYALSLEKSGVQEKRARLADLETAAYYDPLTGLPNYTKFKLDAQRLLLLPEPRYLLLKFDICNFKSVNEIFGFHAGDEVICALGELLPSARAALELETRLFARSNADEFVLLEPLGSHSAPTELHSALLTEMLADRLAPILGPHRLEFRYGRYLIEPGEDIDAALEKVILAHRMAKRQQGSSLCDYDANFKETVLRDAEIENRMQSALDADEFIVYLQAKYELAHETVIGAEALVRWRRPDGSLIPPNDFIPLFERNGFIIHLDRYVFDRVCQLLCERQALGLPLLTVSVNFSRLHLSDRGFVQRLKDTVAAYEIPSKYIEIELTESIMFRHSESLLELLRELHAAGFSLSMDDFGSGYSSLGLLKDLPVDVIKMDRTFFGNSMYKTRAKLLIESIMQMAADLGIQTVAEGVEEEEHIHFLREVGCDIVQGYYYARPLPPEDFFRLVDDPPLRNKPLPSAPQLLALSSYQDMPQLHSLSAEIPLSVYRLFLFTLRDTMGRRYGEEATKTLLQNCGRMAGFVLAQKLLDLTLSPSDFFTALGDFFVTAKLAVMDIESIDLEQWTIRITLRDDLDCSGLSPTGETYCQYDEGLIAGILYAYTEREFTVLELDCWGTGAELCRFSISPK